MPIDAFPTTLGGVLDALAELGAGKDWKERLKQGAIITPDSKKHDFLFDDLETEKENKTSTYKFSEKIGSYAQNFGLGESKFPLTCYFHGLQYDKTATTLEKSLGLAGNCTLQHPRYGTKTVVVHGWKREDKEKTSAGQAIFTITMSETLELKVPGSDKKNPFGAFAKIAAFINAGINAFNAISATIDNIANAVNTLTAIINGLSVAMSNIVSATNEIQNKFDNLADSIKTNLTTLMATPDALASALSELFFLPVAAVSESLSGAVVATADGTVSLTVDEVITAYEGAYTTIKGLAPIASDDSGTVDLSLIMELCTSLVVAAEADIYIKGSYLTVDDVTKAITDLSDKFVENQEFLDTLQENTNSNALVNKFTVSDSMTLAMKDLMSFSAAILLDYALTAKKEVIKKLNRDYTIIDLSYDLYGTTEASQIQFLIDTNKLTGENLLIIPRNTEIKYYV